MIISNLWKKKQPPIINPKTFSMFHWVKTSQLSYVYHESHVFVSHLVPQQQQHRIIPATPATGRPVLLIFSCHFTQHYEETCRRRPTSLANKMGEEILGIQSGVHWIQHPSKSPIRLCMVFVGCYISTIILACQNLHELISDGLWRMLPISIPVKWVNCWRPYPGRARWCPSVVVGLQPPLTEYIDIYTYIYIYNVPWEPKPAEISGFEKYPSFSYKTQGVFTHYEGMGSVRVGKGKVWVRYWSAPGWGNLRYLWKWIIIYKWKNTIFTG